MTPVDRRHFLGAAATTAAAVTLSSTARAQSAGSDLIRCAVIGVNGRGSAHISAIENSDEGQVTLLCDPDSKVLAARAKQFEERYGRKVETETDLRRVFDRKDIDVASIATPNHWHALATIWACQAGKDVYVEKPGSHNVFEGRKMIEAAQRYERIVQHGVQLRSNPAIREAVDHLRNGLIGDVYMARALVYRWRPSVGTQPDESAPKHLDWDLWQGPAQEREFSKRYVHYNWHWHWDYGNGDIGNQGVHETDMAAWGLDVGLPTEVTAMGGKFLWDDAKETPEQVSSLLKFEGNKIMQVEVRPWCTNDEQGVGVGNLFYGSKGYLVVDGYRGYRSFLGQKGEPGPARSAEDPMQAHYDNFLGAVRSRDASKLHGPVETAHVSSAIAHLGNIAYRLGRHLKFDPKVEKFVGDPEADEMLTRPYRAPYIVPEVV